MLKPADVFAGTRKKVWWQHFSWNDENIYNSFTETGNEIIFCVVIDESAFVSISTGAICRALRIRRMVSIRIFTVPRSMTAYVLIDKSTLSETSA